MPVSQLGEAKCIRIGHYKQQHFNIWNTFVIKPTIISAVWLIVWEPLNQELITRSLQLLHIPATAFSQTDLFLVEFISNQDPRKP